MNPGLHLNYAGALINFGGRYTSTAFYQKLTEHCYQWSPFRLPSHLHRHLLPTTREGTVFRSICLSTRGSASRGSASKGWVYLQGVCLQGVSPQWRHCSGRILVWIDLDLLYSNRETSCQYSPKNKVGSSRIWTHNTDHHWITSLMLIQLS